jgi:putative transposase
LKGIRAAGNLGLANFSSSQDVLRRVEQTFKAFFRRVKAGQKAGYPRFKSRRRFDSYTFPSYGDGCRLTGTRLYLQGVGHLKVKLHRPVDGMIKTITIKRECGKWYACFSVEGAGNALPAIDTYTGVDVGLTAFATLADGTKIDNPRYYKRAQAQLRLAQRRVARRKCGGKNRYKAVLLLQKAHARIKNQRADFQHKVARTLVNAYGMIAVEDLHIQGLASGMLAKSVNDAGWSSFIAKLAYKAEEAGRRLIQVDPRGTSQACLCGAAVRKTLAQRWHQCPECGLSAARDHVSAQLILGLGLSLFGGT